MKRTVFLDRDGVINQDSPDYIKHPDEFLFIPRSLEAMVLLTRHGFDIILITNQSAIGRKLMTPLTAQAIFQKMKAGVDQAGGRILDIFFCPHLPDAGCDCRKPLPGMILRACTRHGIAPGSSIMVGDSAKDIHCGKAAGCAKNILVSTGNGPTSLTTLGAQGIYPDFYAQDLFEAAQWIIRHMTTP